MFEGIYINENIMGLTKILTELTREGAGRNIIQPQEIKISEVKNKINEFIDTIYTENTTSDIIEPIIPFKKLKLNKQKLEEVYKYNNQLYNTKKIYRSDNPIIKPILDKYNTDSKFIMTHDDNPKDIKEITIKKVDSYKLFYLLTNDNADKNVSININY